MHPDRIISQSIHDLGFENPDPCYLAPKTDVAHCGSPPEFLLFFPSWSATELSCQFNRHIDDMYNYCWHRNYSNV